MLEALIEQKTLYEKFNSKYFFCSSEGKSIHVSNLRKRIWIPTLEKTNLQYRKMMQTRHSFATIALSCGGNPLLVASIMGHRNSEMIIKHYAKYVKKANSNNGKLMSADSIHKHE